MNLGIVGTSFIAHDFADAARSAGFTITGVVSRDFDRGKAFLSRHGSGTVHSSMEDMAANKSIDVVYIASPNALHYPQSLAAIRQGKHVLVEKPCYMSMTQLEEVLRCAEEKSVYVLETLRSFYTPAIEHIRNALPKIGKVRHVYFNRMQYSSRYDSHKAGLPTSTFNKELGGGALGDLGIYVIYGLLDLFGNPATVAYQSQYLDSGVDAVTDLLLGYNGFNSILTASKVSDTHLDSEIQGEQGSILIKSPFLYDEILLKEKCGTTTLLFDCKEIKDMHLQTAALYQIITDKDKGKLARAHQFMRDSTAILDACRS